MAVYTHFLVAAPEELHRDDLWSQLDAFPLMRGKDLDEDYLLALERLAYGRADDDVPRTLQHEPVLTSADGNQMVFEVPSEVTAALACATAAQRRELEAVLGDPHPDADRRAVVADYRRALGLAPDAQATVAATIDLARRAVESAQRLYLCMCL